jgi:hypothetical protein
MEKDSNSTDSMPTENSGITTNSSEKLFQNEQNGTRVDTDFTQEERNNMTAYPTKPSDPSDPSAHNSSLEVSKQTIYRLVHTDMFACHNCQNKGDKWFMKKHLCHRMK